MTYTTNRWHVLIDGEKVAEFAYVAHADLFAAAAGGEVRDAENVAYKASLRAAR